MSNVKKELCVYTEKLKDYRKFVNPTRFRLRKKLNKSLDDMIIQCNEMEQVCKNLSYKSVKKTHPPDPKDLNIFSKLNYKITDK